MSQSDTDKLYKLSPSDFAYLWNDCKHCYYQKVKLGTSYFEAFPGMFTIINTLLQNSIMGMNLKDIHADLSKTIIKISDNPDEHEGFCHVSRGMMLTFRNPSHHQLTDDVTREQALKLCGFVDVLLSILEKSEKIK